MKTSAKNQIQTALGVLKLVIQYGGLILVFLDIIDYAIKQIEGYLPKLDKKSQKGINQKSDQKLETDQ